MVPKRLKAIWQKRKLAQERKVKILFWYTVIYIVGFTIWAVLIRNYEFMYYAMFLGIFVFATTAYYKEFYLSYHVIAGLSLFGFLHIMGGLAYVGQTRLYDLYLIPGIFRYDNFVHLIGAGLGTLIAYNFLRPHLNMRVRHNPAFFGILIVLIALGMGVINEILELIAVVLFNAADSVGDYMNNALDMIFNLLGATLATTYLFVLNKRKRKTPDVILKTRKQK